MGWKYTKDGRLQTNGDHYDAIKLVLQAQQDGKCADCGGPIFTKMSHLHHLNKRGMGGGKREDWIGNDPALVEAAEESLGFLPSRKCGNLILRLQRILTYPKVTTVTLLCPACHGRRHP